jgi:predicted TIM-barrel fold metal-dependent hydrolase
LAGGTTAAGGRFCGVRQSLTWDADTSLTNPLYPTSEHLMDSKEFQAGFAHLAPLGLNFEAWVFFHQLAKLAALARAFPETPIVLNHCGGIIGIAGYAGRRNDVFREWRRGLIELAACPNVMVKLSGLGMRLGGFSFEDNYRAPSSTDLADAWRPWIETCVTAFGSDRCMYGSNFPVDKGSFSYAVGLNGLKRLVAGATPEDKDNIFWRSAKTFYRLPDASLRIASP